MKKTLLALFGSLALLTANAQTPVNFNCDDCSATNHDLFAELAQGKVIVISWVMPCSSCLGPTLTASNIVQSYASSNPGQVLMYVADDNANTSCSSLNSWVTNNGITANAVFSNSAVNQSPYGSPGMPKIVVLGGGSTPTVFFNQNGSAAGNSTNLQNAIDAALATGVNDAEAAISSINVFPNPSIESSTISFVSKNFSEGSVVVYDQLGQKVIDVYSGEFIAGENKFEIGTAELSNGVYFVQINNGENIVNIRTIVCH